MAERAALKDAMPGPPRRPLPRTLVLAAMARRPAHAPLPLEPRGTAPDVTVPAPTGRAVDRIQRASLGLAGLPLSRRIRANRTRLERLLGGSAVLHAVLLVLLALLYARQSRLPPPQDQPPVQMVFGQSGMTGNTSSSDFGGGAPPAKQAPPPSPPAPVPAPLPAPVPPQDMIVNPEIPPAPPPVPLPDFEPVPPVPPPPPPVETPRPQARMEPMRIPMRTTPVPSRTTRSSPFSNPMDLSFSQAEPGPSRSRSGRPGGSHAPVDLSLGPLVKNGHLNTPFATVGIKGVSDDYGAEIDSWIKRHLYYPPDAARRGEDGNAHVHVVIDREGSVKSVRLVNSSGSFALDDSTEGMFRNARLPPVPPDMNGDHFDIDLTVDYILMR